MFPAPVDYHRATDVDDALSRLAGDDARVLAGGHALVTEMKARRTEPGTLVDVSHLDALVGVDRADGIDEAEGAVRIGALTTYADALDAPETASVPVLHDALAEVGDLQVRNRGTVGGNLAQADPDGDLPAAALAADARLRVRSRVDTREIPATEFFVGPNETTLRDDELLTAIRFPATADGGAYVRKTHPSTGYALVGVGACVTVQEGMITESRVAATGATARPARLRGVERGLEGVAVDDDDAVEDAAARAADDLPVDLRGDEHASAEFRGRLLSVHAADAVTRALDRAVADNGGGSA